MADRADPARAVVFPTCLVEQLRPSLARACVALVADADGVGPELATGATCCGQPAWNAGFAAAARRVARRTLRALRGGDGPVVVPSGSCATMMGHHWPELFAGTKDEAAARTLAGRVVELSTYLDRGDADGAGGDAGGPVSMSMSGSVVAVHDSCHGLRELAVKEQPRRLLAEVGITVTETAGAERCCGFGGTFCVKMPAVSVAMADDKLDEWSEAGVTTVVAGDLSCLAHLEGRAGRRGLPLEFRHLAEVLRP
jgi:L-lactate dehydrogenase complex protein LldE